MYRQIISILSTGISIVISITSSPTRVFGFFASLSLDLVAFLVPHLFWHPIWIDNSSLQEASELSRGILQPAVTLCSALLVAFSFCYKEEKEHARELESVLSAQLGRRAALLSRLSSEETVLSEALETLNVHLEGVNQYTDLARICRRFLNRTLVNSSYLAYLATLAPSSSDQARIDRVWRSFGSQEIVFWTAASFVSGIPEIGRPSAACCKELDIEHHAHLPWNADSLRLLDIFWGDERWESLP